MNPFDLISRLFTTAPLLLPPPSTEQGRCKVCGGASKQSEHPRFSYCSSCGCYSNYLPNDIYEDVTWYENISDEIIDRDLGHWRRVVKRAATFIDDQAFSHIVDLAGGVGLFSAAFQEIISAPAVLVDRCTVSPKATRYNTQLPNQLIKVDLGTFLSDTTVTAYERPLLLNSHFIEHLELVELIAFLNALKARFPGAYCCIYCPNAGQAKGKEKDFLHFNTHLPGEHRIIWSLKPLLKLLEMVQIQVIHAEPFDLDILAICKL